MQQKLIAWSFNKDKSSFRITRVLQQWMFSSINNFLERIHFLDDPNSLLRLLIIIDNVQWVKHSLFLFAHLNFQELVLNNFLPLLLLLFLLLGLIHLCLRLQQLLLYQPL